MEELTNKLTKFIRDELSDSQINKDKLSAEYRLGKNEAYSNVLSIITKELQDTIRESVDSLCFSSDDFEVELHMDYDNRVEINSLNFENHECIYDDIIRYIDKQFRVIENEDNPTTDDE